MAHLYASCAQLSRAGCIKAGYIKIGACVFVMFGAQRSITRQKGGPTISLAIQTAWAKRGAATNEKSFGHCGYSNIKID
jgi:hypothetical protein